MPRVPTRPESPLPHPRGAPHDPALDGLRGVAALLIFLFHYGGGLTSRNPLVHTLGVATEGGWTGVVLFFTLSGFLITGGLWDSFSALSLAQWLRNFYARRALRILPLYYGTLLLAGISAWLRGAHLLQIRPLLLFAVFLQNVPGCAARALNNASPLPLYHLWSIAVEEQFYLVWPALLLLTLLLPQRRRHICAVLLCAVVFLGSLLYRVLLVAPNSPGWFRALAPFQEFFPVYAGALALGAAMALLQRSRADAVLLRIPYLALVVGLGIFAGTSALCHNLYLNPPLQFTLGLAGVSLASAGLISIARRPGLVRVVLSLPPVVWVGRISYGFYVIQVLIQPLVHRIGLTLLHVSSGNLYFGLRFVVALVLSLFAAWLSFLWIERPFLRAKRFFPMRPAVSKQ